MKNSEMGIFPLCLYNSVFVRVLKRNRIHVYINTDIDERTFITGIGSHNYGGQEDPQYAICKLGTRKASCLIQSELQDLRTRGKDEAEGLRNWNSNV